jgi:thioredoxin 1
MKQFSGKIDVVEICTDDLPETSAECGVVSIPTIQFYYRGELLDTIVGCVARNVLASAVTKVLEDVSVDSDTEESQRSLKEDEA